MSGPHPVPMFAAHAEQKAMESLHAVLAMAREGQIAAPSLRMLREHASHLVDAVCAGDDAAVTGLASLDGSDYAHPVRSAVLAALIGREMGMTRGSLDALALSTMLMNAGYVALKRSVLDEPRRLLDGEWEEHVHTHPTQSVALLASSACSREELATIAQHHERWDGSGYPAGISGDAICVAARIVAVADTYVSLRSVRPHRPAFDAESAMGLLLDDAGTLFDPTVTEAAIAVIGRSAPDASQRDARLPSSVTATADDAPRNARRDRPEEIDRGTAERLRERDRDEREAMPAPQRDRARLSARIRDGRAPAGATAGSAPPATASRGTVDPDIVAGHDVSPTATADAARRSAMRARRRGLYATRLYVDHARSGGWRVDTWAPR